MSTPCAAQEIGMQIEREGLMEGKRIKRRMGKHNALLTMEYADDAELVAQLANIKLSIHTHNRHTHTHTHTHT